MAQALIDQELDKLTPYLYIIQVRKLRALTNSFTQYVDYDISSLKPKKLRVLNHFFSSNSPIPEEVVALDLEIRVFLEDNTATANYLLTRQAFSQRETTSANSKIHSIILDNIKNLLAFKVPTMELYLKLEQMQVAYISRDTLQIIVSKAQFCNLGSQFYHDKQKIILKGFAQLFDNDCPGK